MTIPAPHFLLFSESSRYAPERQRRARPQWRFVLESVDGSSKLEACDEEPNVRGDRLDLLAVVRGLEALDQPSRVTLVTPSQYVSRGLRSGLEQWRETGWQWERFGEMTPIKNDDLWRRVDRALRYHQVEVRTWRLDSAESGETAPKLASTAEVAPEKPTPIQQQRATTDKPGNWRRRARAAVLVTRRSLSDFAARVRQIGPLGRQSVTA
ncbi:MAG: RNase H family protein [Pirellulaceae bacterium]